MNGDFAAAVDEVLRGLPPSHNADLGGQIRDLVRLAAGSMSWEALAWALDTARLASDKWRARSEVELLWSGPAPPSDIPARRIDQALYDLVSDARSDVLLVTFAATRVSRLADALLGAVRRGVRVRLVLEFEGSSEGQLSHDALDAFPDALRSAVEVYHWPIDRRDRNQLGRPGKLHAKIALIDDTALVSSANLTDDAFTRNLEIGVMLRAAAFIATARSHIKYLISSGVLAPMK